MTKLFEIFFTEKHGYLIYFFKQRIQRIKQNFCKTNSFYSFNSVLNEIAVTEKPRHRLMYGVI